MPGIQPGPTHHRLLSWDSINWVSFQSNRELCQEYSRFKGVVPERMAVLTLREQLFNTGISQNISVEEEGLFGHN